MDKTELPLYELIIDEDLFDESGVFAVGIVREPAIEVGAMFFSEDKDESLTFEIQDKDQRIISGPVMIADKKIFRKDENDEGYYIVFTKETIKMIMQKFFYNGHQNSTNLEHNPLMNLNGVTMFESFQVDRERGINPPKGYEDISDGSWFASYKVYDEKVWELIKKGNFKGFSIEINPKFKVPVEDKEFMSYGEYTFIQELSDIIKNT